MISLLRIALPFLLAAASAGAQTYPTKAVRLIVADAAGGAPDQLARILAQRDPSIRFVAPMAGEMQRNYFRQLIDQAGLQDVDITVLTGHSHTAMAAADAVLVASGTATLEVALFKKPMVIAYKMMRASWWVLRHMGYQPWIGLPNILAREFLVPELLQDAATPAALADAVMKQLQDAAHRELLQQRFTDMHHSLLRNTAAESAQAVLQLIGKRP